MSNYLPRFGDRTIASAPTDWADLSQQLRAFTSASAASHSLEGYLNQYYGTRQSLPPPLSGQYDRQPAGFSSPNAVRYNPTPTHVFDPYDPWGKDNPHSNPSFDTPPGSQSGSLHVSAAPTPSTETPLAPAPRNTFADTKPTPTPSSLGQVQTTIATDSGKTAWISQGGVTRDQTLAFSGSVVSGAQVAVYDGDTWLGLATVQGNRWSFTTPKLAEGKHQFSFQFTLNTQTQTESLSATIDTTAPNGSFHATVDSDDGPLKSGEHTSDRSLVLSGVAEAQSTVYLYDGSQLLAVLPVNAKGQWSFKTAGLATGQHDFHMWVEDNAGNRQAVTGPAITVMEPVNLGTVDGTILTDAGKQSAILNGGVSKDNTLGFHGTIAESGKVEVYEGDRFLGLATVTNGQWTFTTPALADGAHQFQFRMQVGDKKSSHTLKATVDTVAPDGHIDSLRSDDQGVLQPGQTTTDDTLELQGSAEALSHIAIYDGSRLLGHTTADSRGHWQFTTPSLPTGQHAFHLTVEDKAGNIAELKGPSVTITAPVTQPEPPTSPSPSPNPSPKNPDSHPWSDDSGWGQVDALAALRKVTGKDLADVQAQKGTPWGIDSSNINDAWHYGYTGKGVTVAVIDSGIDTRNTDITHKLSAKSWDFVDNDANVMDEKGHGTFVASEIFAANNGVGLTGAAYDAELLALRVLNSEGKGALDDVAKAIRYAVDQGARIANLSLGGETPSDAIEDAIRYAQDHNVLIVAAAGNDGQDNPLSPARYAHKYNNVVAVGASTKQVDGDIDLAYFSNKSGTGPYNFLTAAGQDVQGYDLQGNISLWKGTSMAAPYVSAVAALLLSANDKLTAAELASTLNQTAFGI